MGYEQIAIPDDHLLVLTGRMVRETRDEIEALKAAAEKAERERKEQVDWSRTLKFRWDAEQANLARANREQYEEIERLKSVDNEVLIDLQSELSEAVDEIAKLKRELSEMKGYKESWEREAWDTLSMLNKERDKNKALSSALTEQEACTGREILRTQAQKQVVQFWKDAARQAADEFGKLIDQVADLKTKLGHAEAAANSHRRELDDLEPKLADALEDCENLKRQLAQKQARAKRQTALLKALRKEVGSEVFDKSYQDSLGAEKKKELAKIVDNMIASYLSDVYTKSTRNLFVNGQWRHGVEHSNPIGGAFIWRSEVIK